jgi:23S rRNA pseudouridine2605 synthase
MTKQRLSKVLAAAGVASRRAAETYITKGRVTVNGTTVLIPQTPVDPKVDQIKVDGKKIAAAPSKLYFALHKPVGYYCTMDARIKRRAVDLVEAPKGVRLFTVGRLDRMTSGLLLVTNDGHFANRVMHPSGEIRKEYIAKVNHEITHEHLVALSEGCVVQGVRVKPVRVSKIRRSTVRIVVQEGRRHEVREMLEAVGLTVIELKRVKVGELSLGSLPVGKFKPISPEDVL